MSYEHCELHDMDATNGCVGCEVDRLAALSDYDLIEQVTSEWYAHRSSSEAMHPIVNLYQDRLESILRNWSQDSEIRQIPGRRLPCCPVLDLKLVAAARSIDQFYVYQDGPVVIRGISVRRLGASFEGDRLAMDHASIELWDLATNRRMGPFPAALCIDRSDREPYERPAFRFERDLLLAPNSCVAVHLIGAATLPAQYADSDVRVALPGYRIVNL
jgi:hypothetical protein